LIKDEERPGEMFNLLRIEKFDSDDDGNEEYYWRSLLFDPVITNTVDRLLELSEEYDTFIDIEHQLWISDHQSPVNYNGVLMDVNSDVSTLVYLNSFLGTDPVSMDMVGDMDPPEILDIAIRFAQEYQNVKENYMSRIQPNIKAARS